MAIDTLIESRKYELNGMLAEYSATSEQLRGVRNQKAAISDVLSSQMDRISQSIRSLSSFDDCQFKFDNKVEVQLVGEGSEVFDRASAMSAEEVQYGINKYLTNFGQGGIDYYSWVTDVRTQQSYYVAVASRMDDHKTNWIRDFGRLLEYPNDGNLRYYHFLRCIYRAGAEYSNKAVDRLLSSQIHDELIGKDISSLLDFVVNPGAIPPLQASVNSESNPVTPVGVRVQLQRHANHLTDRDSRLAFFNLIPSVENESLRGLILSRYNDLLSGGPIAQLNELLASIGTEDVKTVAMETIVYFNTGSAVKTGSEELDSTFLDLSIKLLYNQILKEHIHIKSQQLDIQDTNACNELLRQVARVHIDQYIPEWDTEAGLLSIRSHIASQVYPEELKNKYLSDLDVIEGKFDILDGAVQCNVPTEEAVQSLREGVEAVLTDLPEFRNPDLLEGQLQSLLDHSGNTSLAKSAYKKASRLGTDDDPVKEFVEKLQDYFDGLEVFSDMDVEALEESMNEIFSRVAQAYEPSKASAINHIVADAMGSQRLPSYQRESYYDKIRGEMILIDKRTNFQSLGEYLDMIIEGNVGSHISDFQIVSYYPSSIQDRISRILLVMAPRGTISYNRSDLLDELSGLLGTTGSGISDDQISLVIQYINTIIDNRLIHSDKEIYIKQIQTITNTNQIVGNIGICDEILHILIGDVVGDRYLNMLRRYVLDNASTSSTISYYTTIRERFEFIVDGTISSGILTQLLESISSNLGEMKSSTANHCIELASEMVNGDRFENELRKAEILYYFIDYNSNDDWLIIMSGMDQLMEAGYTIAEREAVYNQALLDIHDSDLPYKALVSGYVNNYYEARYSDETFELMRQVAVDLIPDDIEEDIQDVFDTIDYALAEIYEFPFAIWDFMRDAECALGSIARENCLIADQAVFDASAAVHNTAMSIRLSVLDNPVMQILRTTTVAANMGGYVAYPGFMSLFGADEVMGIVNRTINTGVAMIASSGYVTQMVSGLVPNTAAMFIDMTNATVIQSARHTIIGIASSVDSILNDVLCTLDILVHLIEMLNGLLTVDISLDIPDLELSLDLGLDNLKNSINNLINSISELASIDIGVDCICISAGFSSRLELPNVSISNWTWGFGMELPDVDLLFSAPNIDPMLGCPGSWL